MARILIVDDDEQNRFVLETALTKDGHEIASAENGAEALELAENDLPDLVVSDIMMPVMDGYEFCRRWKTVPRFKPVPFIFFSTTYTDPRDKQLGIRLGADRIIIGPKLETLREAVREILEERRGGRQAPAAEPKAPEQEILREYGEVTFRKLLQKVKQLEEAGAAREKAEEALRESEEQYRSLVDHAPIGIVVHEKGTIRFMNKFAADSIGVKDPKECEGRNVLELIHPDHHDAIKARMLRSEREAGLLTETRILAPDGRTLDAEITSVPVSYRGKRCVMAMVQDISERKEAEALVEESWLAYMTLAENLPGIFYRVHLQEDGRLEFFNKKLEDLTGFHEEELGPWKFSPLESLLLPEDRVRAAAEMGRFISGQKAFTAEYRVRHKDGSVRWMEEHATGISDHDRQPLCIDGAIFDITEHKEAEARIRASDEMQRMVLETAEIGIFQWDIKEKKLLPSPTCYTMLGREPKPGPADPAEWENMLHPDDSERVAKITRQAAAGELGRYNYEARLRHADGGYRWHLVRCFATEWGNDGKAIRMMGVRMDITGRKQAEEELREERSLFIGGPSVALKWLTGEGWPVEYASPNIREQFGYAPEDFSGGRAGYLDIIHPDDRARVVDEVRRHKEAGAPCFEQEYRIARADGEYRWVHDFTAAVRGAKGGILHYRGYISDVTGRKLTETALRESEEKFRLCFEEAASGMCMTAIDGRFIAVNRALASMLGYTRNDLVNRNLNEFTHPDDQEKSGNWAARILSGETRETSLTKRYLHRNGGEIWAEVSTALLKDPDGAPLYFITQIRNITYRKRLEDALGESEIKYRTLFERSTNALFIADAGTGEILDANKSAEALTGRTREELIGMNRLQLHPPKEAARCLKRFEDCARAGSAAGLEAVVARKDGSLVPVQISDAAMELNGRKVIHGIFEDISGRKRAEEEQQRLIAELTRANSEMAQFNRLIAHDLQEPLRMVVSYAQLLTKRLAGKLEPSAREFLGYVEEGGMLMQKMVHDLMHYTRAGAKLTEWKEVDMNGVVARALTALQLPIGESKASVSCGRLPAITANEAQMGHLFQNLIGNAVKFRSGDAPRIDISAEEKGGEYVFAVRDDGIGIPPQFAERVFNIFQRLHTRAEYPGTGVGLALCKKIVDGHGGRIWVEPGPEKGSVFRFTIPKRGTPGGGKE